MTLRHKLATFTLEEELNQYYLNNLIQFLSNLFKTMKSKREAYQREKYACVPTATSITFPE